MEKSGEKRVATRPPISAGQSVSRELGVHGPRWARIFDGYFSDAAVARPLLEAVEKAIEISRPSVAADLGGGTGFLLAELLRRGLRSVRPVVVDLSEKQLAACTDGRIAKLQASLDKVERRQLLAGEERLLLMSRSTLHYFGSAWPRPAAETPARSALARRVLRAPIRLLCTAEGCRPDESSLRVHGHGKVVLHEG